MKLYGEGFPAEQIFALRKPLTLATVFMHWVDSWSSIRSNGYFPATIRKRMTPMAHTSAAYIDGSHSGETLLYECLHSRSDSRSGINWASDLSLDTKQYNYWCLPCIYILRRQTRQRATIPIALTYCSWEKQWCLCKIALHSQDYLQQEIWQQSRPKLIAFGFTRPLYAFFPADRMTSGERYSAVPTKDAGAEWNRSCCSMMSLHSSQRRQLITIKDGSSQNKLYIDFLLASCNKI